MKSGSISQNVSARFLSKSFSTITTLVDFFLNFFSGHSIVVAHWLKDWSANLKTGSCGFEPRQMLAFPLLLSFLTILHKSVFYKVYNRADVLNMM